MTSVNKFISNYFPKDGQTKQYETENIKKIYNKDFDILIYNIKNKSNTIVIDKRDKKTKIYNNLEIASAQLQKK